LLSGAVIDATVSNLTTAESSKPGGSSTMTTVIRSATILWGLSLALAGACGGGAKRAKSSESGAAYQRADAERRALEADKPKNPYIVKRTLAFRPEASCSQGPFALQTEAIGSTYGEQLQVFACGRHEIAGRYRIKSNRSTLVAGQESGFGFQQDNQRCRATHEELGARGGGAAEDRTASSRQSSSGTDIADGSKREGAAAESDFKVELVPVAAVQECPAGLRRTHIVHHTWESPSGPPVESGADITLELWSTQPNDLEELFFVVIQRGVEETMTDEGWADFRRKSEEWYARYQAFVDGEVAAGRSHYTDDVDKGAHGKPPAPKAETQPPRPSKNAKWIAGYWHWETTWLWIGGWWRVPDSDVEQQLTVRAPTPPPPPRVEEREPAPPSDAAAPPSDAAAPPDERTASSATTDSTTVAVGASADTSPTRSPAPGPGRRVVWVPGYWQWSGTQWIWIKGSWRLPPKAGYRWRPSRWRKSASGSIFVPGGWTIRVGR